jgi:hypothetical protein
MEVGEFLKLVRTDAEEATSPVKDRMGLYEMEVLPRV